MQLQIAQAEEKCDQNGQNVAAATQAMTKAVAAAEEVSSVRVSVWFGLVRFGSVRFYFVREDFLPCHDEGIRFGFGFGFDFFLFFQNLFPTPNRFRESF